MGKSEVIDLLDREASEKNNKPDLAFLNISTIFATHNNSYISD